jgi:YgiT-type zinc finger domain-containing protein
MRSRNNNKARGYPCDYCRDGQVENKIRPRELIRVSKTDYVALEQVPIGVCTRCKAKYYGAAVLKQAEALHRKGGRRKVQIPVTRYVRAS